mmetsp:Transcript_20524/g.46498  ORF Transcript_20524/g.46498 Transcript_20524/m.46498 type:complete len:355 (+) Transcript_20524:907-1971(+)
MAPSAASGCSLNKLFSLSTRQLYSSSAPASSQATKSKSQLRLCFLTSSCRLVSGNATASSTYLRPLSSNRGKWRTTQCVLPICLALRTAILKRSVVYSLMMNCIFFSSTSFVTSSSIWFRIFAFVSTSLFNHSSKLNCSKLPFHFFPVASVTACWLDPPATPKQTKSPFLDKVCATWLVADPPTPSIASMGKDSPLSSSTARTSSCMRNTRLAPRSTSFCLIQSSPLCFRTTARTLKPRAERSWIKTCPTKPFAQFKMTLSPGASLLVCSLTRRHAAPIDFASAMIAVVRGESAEKSSFAHLAAFQTPSTRPVPGGSASKSMSPSASTSCSGNTQSPGFKLVTRGPTMRTWPIP